VKARDRLRLWVQHLALNTAEAEQLPRTSILLGSDGCWKYAPVGDARGHLRQLLEVYWKGLCLPLKFFPRLSYEYARAIRAGKPAENAWSAARQGWEGSGSGETRRSGEGEDPYLALCFAAGEPLDVEFAQLAEAIFGPLLDHEVIVKGR
jgi:exodeoxyribonuclease V gamma subunit